MSNKKIKKYTLARIKGMKGTARVLRTEKKTNEKIFCFNI